MIKKITFLFFILWSTFRAFSQCSNIGFEDGATLGWICGSGAFGDTSANACKAKEFPIRMNYNGACLNQGGVDGSSTPVDFGQNRHTIMTGGTDPNSLDKIPCVAPGYLFPINQNFYSFRLGNARGSMLTANDPVDSDSLSYSEGIKFKINVDASNIWLTYLYSVFFSNLKNLDSMHPESFGPQFIVKLSDSKDSIISGGYKRIIADQSLHTGREEFGTQEEQVWYYSDWTKVTYNLSAYIGQTITVEFITTDCYVTNIDLLNINNCYKRPGQHSTYAYIDMYCQSLADNINENNKKISIDVYPNPIDTELNIQVDGLNTSAELKIYDCLGKEIKALHIKNGIQQLSRENLASGIYFLEISSQGEILSKQKIIITD